MTQRLSTKLANMLAGEQITYEAVNKIAAVAAGNKLTDSDNKFLSEGFRPGMIIEISGFTTAANDQIAVITSVASDGSEMVVVTEVALVDDDANTTITLTAYGQSLKDILSWGVLCIYTGSQPSSPDVAPTGTKLLEITNASGAFTKGTKTNGLEWDAPVAGVLGKKDADTWSDAGLESGTAGWFRLYANDFDTGADALCLDGAVGTSGSQLNLASTSIVKDATTTIDEFEITVPLTP